MNSKKNLVGRRIALQALALASVAPAAFAQNGARARTGRAASGADAAPSAVGAWPTQPIRLLVGFPPGSVQDISARIIAPGLAAAFGKPVIVENKAGASGTIAADMVSRATDLHTFGVMNNSQLTVAKILTPAIAYDPITDLTPIAMIGTTPLMLVVSNASPGKTAAEHVAWLRNLGDKGNYGSPGTGTPGHLGMELLKSRANMSTMHIPYPGNPQVITALMGGQLHAGFLPPGLVLPHVQSGKLKAVAVSSETRSPLAPDYPSLNEINIKGAELELWSALAGPRNLPQEIVDRLSAAAVTIVRETDVRGRLLTAGWQPTPTNAVGLRGRIRSDTRTFGGIILMRGIHVDA
ncbi:Bug family tripartite tricarboxylate transporter substrate binding protein [Ramlibacter sp. MMS24-I3-19]|uniref:Bug family tripartite tricarboxylate transporter substrate binding protein n=1 Tax=Ramlibacter sp. MMS24-I3-19 TaxID=3416606 RepID=UPI003D033CF8